MRLLPLENYRKHHLGNWNLIFFFLGKRKRDKGNEKVRDYIPIWGQNLAEKGKQKSKIQTNLGKSINIGTSALIPM